MTVKIASLRECTGSEGPGSRFAIWVQGCTLKCHGCFNPHMWGSKGGDEYSVQDLVEKIKEAKILYPEIEGVTILGGEPFEQSNSLAELTALIKEEGLSTMVFSGYTFEELTDITHENVQHHLQFISNIDLLVDGRFVSTQIDNVRPWVGSTNQRFHFLTPRYSRETLFQNQRDSIQLKVTISGIVEVNGWATTESLEILLESL